MNVRIDAARRDQQAFAGDDIRARSDDDVDARLDVRVAGLAQPRDPSVLDREIAFDDARPVDDQRIRDDRIHAIACAALALSHAVADDLAAAELHLVAVRGEIALHLDDQVGVGKPHTVAHRRAEHLGIRAASDLHRARLRTIFTGLRGDLAARDGSGGGPSSGPITAPLKP